MLLEVELSKEDDEEILEVVGSIEKEDWLEEELLPKSQPLNKTTNRGRLNNKFFFLMLKMFVLNNL